MASTISATATQTGFANATKTYNLADLDMADVIAAYQSDANVSVNGTATRAQVLAYIFDNVLVAPIKAKVAAFRTVVTPGAAPVIA